MGTASVGERQASGLVTLIDSEDETIGSMECDGTGGCDGWPRV